MEVAVRQETRMTLADLLCYLRQQLLDAKERKDEKILNDLWAALNLIEDAAINCKDGIHADIADEMICALRDFAYGVEWKSNIPTVEAIRAASAEKNDARDK